jgi:hypothetical protein
MLEASSIDAQSHLHELPVKSPSRQVRGGPGTLRFRYRFRRLRTSDGLCVVHLPVPRVTSRLSDGRGSANKVEFLLSEPVQIVFG